MAVVPRGCPYWIHVIAKLWDAASCIKAGERCTLAACALGTVGHLAAAEFVHTVLGSDKKQRALQ